jgi:hypothetical protein
VIVCVIFQAKYSSPASVNGEGPNQNKQEDGRRDTEANFTIKQYTTTTPSGEKVTNKKKWFGYRLHLIIDATYELPIGYELTKASEGEPTVAKRLIKALPDAQLKSCNYLLADRGYDGGPLLDEIESRDIIPIIDIKNQWKKEGPTKQYRDTDLTYTYNGKVFYVDERGQEVALVYKGYDSATDSLRGRRYIFRRNCSTIKSGQQEAEEVIA